MCCLRFFLVFLIDDVGLYNVIKFIIGFENKLIKNEIKDFVVNWVNWEFYVIFYLWWVLY